MVRFTCTGPYPCQMSFSDSDTRICIAKPWPLILILQIVISGTLYVYLKSLGNVRRFFMNLHPPANSKKVPTKIHNALRIGTSNNHINPIMAPVKIAFPGCIVNQWPGSAAHNTNLSLPGSCDLPNYKHTALNGVSLEFRSQSRGLIF